MAKGSPEEIKKLWKQSLYRVHSAVVKALIYVLSITDMRISVVIVRHREGSLQAKELHIGDGKDAVLLEALKKIGAHQKQRFSEAKK